MKKITLEAYLASELKSLSPAQNRVLNEYAEINITNDWYEPVIQDFLDRLEEFGIYGANVEFTLSWSQGDGARFTSNTVDTDILVRRLYELGYGIEEDAAVYSGNYSVVVEKVPGSISTRYSHEHTITAKMYMGDTDPLPGFDTEKLECAVTEWVRAECRKLYDNLGRYYMELTSSAAVLETLDANEFFFTEGGQLIPMS